jgi:hypothetical protein
MENQKWLQIIKNPSNRSLYLEQVCLEEHFGTIKSIPERLEPLRKHS